MCLVLDIVIGMGSMAWLNYEAIIHVSFIICIPHSNRFRYHHYTCLATFDYKIIVTNQNHNA